MKSAESTVGVTSNAMGQDFVIVFDNTIPDQQKAALLKVERNPYLIFTPYSFANSAVYNPNVYSSSFTIKYFNDFTANNANPPFLSVGYNI